MFRNKSFWHINDFSVILQKHIDINKIMTTVNVVANIYKDNNNTTKNYEFNRKIQGNNL